MNRYVLTGAPGAGKTAILRQLELEGFSVVEEAATDIIALWQAKGIAEPWTHPGSLMPWSAFNKQESAGLPPSRRSCSFMIDLSCALLL